jgi:hypothetical protein
MPKVPASTKSRLVYDVDVAFNPALTEDETKAFIASGRDNLIDGPRDDDNTLFRLMFDSIEEAQAFKFPKNCTIVGEQEIAEVQDPSGGWDEVFRMDVDIDYSKGTARKPRATRKPRTTTDVSPMGEDGRLRLRHRQKGYIMRNYVVPSSIIAYLEEVGRATAAEMAKNITLEIIDGDDSDDNGDFVSGISRGTIMQALEAMEDAGLVGWESGERAGSKVWSVNVVLTDAEQDLYNRITDHDHTSVRACRPKWSAIPKGYKVPKDVAPAAPAPEPEPTPPAPKPKPKPKPKAKAKKSDDVRTIYEIEVECRDASVGEQNAFYRALFNHFRGEVGVQLMDGPEDDAWYTLTAKRLEDAQTVYDVFGTKDWPMFENYSVMSARELTQRLAFHDEQDEEPRWATVATADIDLKP